MLKENIITEIVWKPGSTLPKNTGEILAYYSASQTTLLLENDVDDLCNFETGEIMDTPDWWAEVPRAEIDDEESKLYIMCSKCKSGIMEHDGKILYSCPPKYPHACTKCGHKDNLFKKYPISTQEEADRDTHSDALSFTPASKEEIVAFASKAEIVAFVNIKGLSEGYLSKEEVKSFFYLDKMEDDPVDPDLGPVGHWLEKDRRKRHFTELDEEKDFTPVEDPKLDCLKDNLTKHKPELLSLLPDIEPLPPEACYIPPHRTNPADIPKIKVLVQENIEELMRYIELDNSEVGEACTYLCDLYRYDYVVSKPFFELLKEEIVAQLNNFKDNCKVVEEIKVVEHTVTKLVWDQEY